MSIAGANDEVKTLMGSLLGQGTGRVSSDEAAEIARDMFDVEGVARPLGGERDENFRIDAAGGVSYVLKISHPAEDLIDTEFQVAALAHLARDGAGLVVPQPVSRPDGRLFGLIESKDGEPRAVRLLTYLSGELLHTVTPSPELMREIGNVTARLDSGLSGLEVTRPATGLLWDFANVTRLRPLLKHIEGDDIASPAAGAISAFEEHVVETGPLLRSQILHNDLNPHNILVSADAPRRVSGILDFGDMIHGPLIGDLAIACCYHLEPGDNPLAGVAACVGGYHQYLPLCEKELELLPYFMAARQAMTVLITEWRARENPENRDYILRNNASARTGLQELARLSRNQAQDLLVSACEGSVQ
ncbi:phosphotransferase [Parasphingopyxis marina]|uniref:Hydroxylysine kinase n=1 Tax=Parasphingopyxis marina TaxID=2761622 RepID=A0A842I0D4_9SPHN|nr:phosphotransferase [Parasphingopyxis marina]MBC2778946.1 phosphotransferase [Parasphingopyxis marina]